MIANFCSRREQKRSLASQATQAQLSEEDEVGDVLNFLKFILSPLILNRIRLRGRAHIT